MKGLLGTTIKTVCVFLLLCSMAAAGDRALSNQVHSEINLARTDPKGYAGFLREFRKQFEGKAYRLSGTSTRVITSEGLAAVDEAIRFLTRQKPLPPLSWSDGLAAAAAELVEEQSETGTVGHFGKASGGMRQRIERHGEWQGEIGENIGYGPDEARLVAMQLIIDDGVPGRGHRKNIFHRAFGTAGVACGPHSVFGTMCVIDFAGGFREEE
ncbi:MAG: CAP domain-containing protein [Geobacter sp.]|nr:CAP domain-containing protein [Geobacter sp.]